MSTNWDQTIAILPIGIAGVLSWAIWIYRFTLSHRAKPITVEYSADASVVVPIYQEDPLVLAECSQTWHQGPVREVLLVVDFHDHTHDALQNESAEVPVRMIRIDHRGKRSALAAGIRAARSEIVILIDSDTAWAPDLAREIVRPFADSMVGGVGSRQKVAAPESSVWRAVAAWLLDIRFLDYIPATGMARAVPCLSGRTVAYRRHVVLPVLPDLEHEIFFGKECVAGDDGRLTWLTLASGYQTVHQPSAIAISMFPDTFAAFMKQRTRWARNSWRCYLTVMHKGWLWRQPFITQLTVIQPLMTWATMGLSLTFFVIALFTAPTPVVAGLFVWAFLGRAVRGISHLRENPRDIVLLPLIVVITIVMALPIKVYAGITMNRQGWLTRTPGQVGGEGQTSVSLTGHSIVE